MDQHAHHEIDINKATTREKKAFYLALIVAFVFMLVEVIGGFFANSLALISDALHMFTDVGALALGLLVVYFMKKPVTFKRTYGYQRAEVLGALASGVTLWVLIAFIVYEAIERLINPPPVRGLIVFVIAIIGLVANFIMLKLLRPGKKGSLNLKAAYLHVIGDFLGSVGVIISGIIIWLTNWYPIDPICTIFFACIILYSSGKMIKQAVDILMEKTPSSIDTEKILDDLLHLPGIMEVHDLHIWNISTKVIALSAHLISNKQEKKILHIAHEMLRNKYNIFHTTLQIEKPDEFSSNYQCFECQKIKKRR